MEHDPIFLENVLLELMNRRERQVLVHSILYYKYDINLIEDWQWSEWTKQLCRLRDANRDIFEKSKLANVFQDFDYSTGADLPLDDAWANGVAKRLMASNGFL